MIDLRLGDCLELMRVLRSEPVSLWREVIASEVLDGVPRWAYPDEIQADELAKMYDEQFLAYIIHWANVSKRDFWELLVTQNARRLDWNEHCDKQRRIEEAQKQMVMPL